MKDEVQIMKYCCALLSNTPVSPTIDSTQPREMKEGDKQPTQTTKNERKKAYEYII